LRLAGVAPGIFMLALSIVVLKPLAVTPAEQAPVPAPRSRTRRGWSPRTTPPAGGRARQANAACQPSIPGPVSVATAPEPPRAVAGEGAGVRVPAGGGTVGLLIVLLLYVLDLRNQGWTWHYVALLGAMLASTDAVAIVATMKSGAGRARAPLGTRSPRPAPDREPAARG